MSGIDDVHFAERVNTNQTLAAINQLLVPIIAALFLVCGTLFWSQFQAIKGRQDQTVEQLVEQQINAARYYERIDKIASIQANQVMLYRAMGDKVEGIDDRVITLEEYRRQQISGTRPDR